MSSSDGEENIGKSPVDAVPSRRWRKCRWMAAARAGVYITVCVYISAYIGMRLTQTLRFYYVCTTGFNFAKAEGLSNRIGPAAETAFLPPIRAEYRLRQALDATDWESWLIWPDLVCPHEHERDAHWRLGVRLCPLRDWEMTPPPVERKSAAPLPAVGSE